MDSCTSGSYFFRYAFTITVFAVPCSPVSKTACKRGRTGLRGAVLCSVPNTLWLYLLLLPTPGVETPLVCFLQSHPHLDHSQRNYTFKGINAHSSTEMLEYRCLFACRLGFGTESGRPHPHPSQPREDREEKHPGTWTTGRVSLRSDTASGPWCWDLRFPSVVRGRERVSYSVWDTHFVLFGDRVYQEVGPDVVHVWNQDGRVLRNAVRWIEVWLKSLVPVLPVTYTAGRIPS